MTYNRHNLFEKINIGVANGNKKNSAKKELSYCLTRENGQSETYFINQNAFLNLIQDLTFPKNDTISPNDDQPEPLD